MQPEYKKYIQKQNKFNKWELDYIANLSTSDKLDRFVELFEIKPEDKTLQGKHQKHLNNLINSRKYFKTKTKVEQKNENFQVRSNLNLK